LYERRFLPILKGIYLVHREFDGTPACKPDETANEQVMTMAKAQLPGEAEHEIGDPQVIVTQAQITEAFQSCGVGPGDILMLHASLSSMGTVCGGAEAVVDGLIAATSPAGTVAVPSLWWRPLSPPLKLEDWDVTTSPAFTGTIAEAVRKRPDACRSDHHSHAVAAIGHQAEALTRTHGQQGLRPGPFGEKAFATDSPWAKLLLWNAAYAFLGVDFTVNTMGHYIEYEYVDQVLHTLPPDTRPRFIARLRSWFMTEGVWSSFSFRSMGCKLEEAGLVARRRIGTATLRVIRVAAMVEWVLHELRAHPEEWFTPKFLAWLRDAEAADAIRP
jgi:aminoglycoside 3-N-acetyltransferase